MGLGLVDIIQNATKVTAEVSQDLFWLAAHTSGELIQNDADVHHKFDSLFTKPANLAYVVNLVYLNTFADFVGISSDGFPPKEVMNAPVGYFLQHNDEAKVDFKIRKSRLSSRNCNCKIYDVSWNSVLRTGWKENDKINACLHVPENAKGITIAVNGYREPSWLFQQKMTEGALDKESAVLYLPSPFHMQRCPKRALNGALMINYAMPRNTGFAQLPIDILTAVTYLSDPRYNKVMDYKNVKIGYIGTSLGAIMGLWTFLKVKEHNKHHREQFKEADVAIFIVGGIGVPGIIKESALFRDLNALINPNNRTLINGYDPQSILPNIDLPIKNIYAVIARHDTVVPTKYQELMVNELGIPAQNTLWLPIGHSNIFFQHREIEPLVTSAIRSYFG